jgi:hypothetical protein
MTFEEYLDAAIKQLEAIQEASKEHFENCTEMCTHCAMYVLIPTSIATISSALASEEQGICDDPNCINNIAYNIAKLTFEEIERKSVDAEAS